MTDITKDTKLVFFTPKHLGRLSKVVQRRKQVTLTELASYCELSVSQHLQRPAYFSRNWILACDAHLEDKSYNEGKFEDHFVPVHLLHGKALVIVDRWRTENDSNSECLILLTEFGLVLATDRAVTATCPEEFRNEPQNP